MRICTSTLVMLCVLLVKVVDSNPWIRKAWTNNNAESYNHVLKTKTQWRTMKRVTDLVDSVRDLVQLQIKDLRRALHGEGNFALCGPFTRHHVSYSAWQTMSADRRDELFAKYLRDSGRRQQPAAVTATDGGLKVLNTSKVARKPGQRKRPRATRTTSAN